MVFKCSDRGYGGGQREGGGGGDLSRQLDPVMVKRVSRRWPEPVTNVIASLEADGYLAAPLVFGTLVFGA